MDIDDALQQRLLSKLSEYGDSFLYEDDDHKQTKKAKLKNALRSVSNPPDGIPRPPSTKGTTKKKRKKKKTVVTNSDDVGLVKHKGKRPSQDFDEEIRQFKEEMLAKERQEMEAELRKEAEGVKRSRPEVIVFEDPSRRKKKKISGQVKMETSRDQFNLRSARHEVRQFGLTGFSFEDQEKCEADRAISLGAWAPKREYINYKEYTVIQKRKKNDERQQREVDRKMGYSVAKKSTTEKTRVKKQGFWRDATQDKKFFLDGQVGRYKQGVQVVSKGDITRTKAQSRKGNRGAKANKIKL